MGREVRKVPADWQHPRDKDDTFIPLFDSNCYKPSVDEWDRNAEKWNHGEFPDYADDVDKKLTYAEWAGERPKLEDYMPDWTDEERTHLMMYENTTEGTPISPAFATPEELARWLADSGASAFANMTADYDHWLAVANGGFAPSMVFSTSHGLQSGVEAIHNPLTSRETISTVY